MKGNLGGDGGVWVARLGEVPVWKAAVVVEPIRRDVMRDFMIVVDDDQWRLKKI
jgi:hypothetical protein